jgi:hypothetical protein
LQKRYQSMKSQREAESGRKREKETGREHKTRCLPKPYNRGWKMHRTDRVGGKFDKHSCDIKGLFGEIVPRKLCKIYQGNPVYNTKKKR